MQDRFLVAIASLGFAVAVLPAAAAQSISGQDLTPEGRGAYVAIAGATDLFAVRSAEMALEKARRPEVRDVAQAMLTAHRSSMQQLGEVARSVGLEDQLPPGMLPMHWDMLRRLENASASRFDRIYIDQQIVAHEVAFELHRNFVANGLDPRLKEYAQAALPMASRHLEQARQVEQ